MQRQTFVNATKAEISPIEYYNEYPNLHILYIFHTALAKSLNILTDL